MNEDHDPRRYASLEHALKAQRIPVENHALIRAFTDAIGIEGYYERAGYIKAVRCDGNPPLHITYGWTNGFRSHEEATRPGIAEAPWRSARGWGISHAENKLREGNAPKNATREPTYCLMHGYQLNALGECDACAG